MVYPRCRSAQDVVCSWTVRGGLAPKSAVRTAAGAGARQATRIGRDGVSYAAALTTPSLSLPASGEWRGADPRLAAFPHHRPRADQGEVAEHGEGRDADEERDASR